MAKIAFIVFGILILIIAAPTIIVDNFVSRHFYSSFSTLSNFTYQYAVRDGRIHLEVTNDTDDYWENIGVRFRLYDEIGVPVVDRRGNWYDVDLEIGQMRPGESSTYTSDVLPDHAVSVALHASRQRKARR